VFCSFCNKSQFEVKKVIAGPTVFICNECVEICVDVICGSIGPDTQSAAQLLDVCPPGEQSASEWMQRLIEKRREYNFPGIEKRKRLIAEKAQITEEIAPQRDRLAAIEDELAQIPEIISSGASVSFGV
jgi:hypothetical protein